MTGWVRLHRKLLESSIFDNANLLRVWIWCLLKATHKGYSQMVGLQEINLKEGQFVTGRFKGAAELNLNPNTFYKYLKVLEKMQMVELNSNNKMTVVTIVNWTKYQPNKDEAYQQNNNKITTTYQQRNTNKNDKNDKNRDYSLEIENFRQRYSLDELKAIDQFMDILATTRASGRIADSVVVKVYKEMAKHPNIVVQYATKVVINNPGLHSKKEPYFFGILRNTQADEALRKLNQTENLSYQKREHRDTSEKAAEDPFMVEFLKGRGVYA